MTAPPGPRPAATRRAVLAAGAVGAVGAVGATVLGTGSAAAAAQRRVPTASAAAFVDSVGLQTHLSYSDTPYADLPRVLAALRDLGVRHVRDDLRLDRPDLEGALNTLAAAGIGSTLITGLPVEAPVERYVATASSRLVRVDALEGSNEWDLSGSPTWAQESARRQAALHAAVRADPRLAGVPVLSPSNGYLASLATLAAAGPIAATADALNVHAYPGGLPMRAELGEVAGWAAGTAPGLPVVITETGYHDALAGPVGHPPVSEAVAASYLPRLFLDCFRAGVQRTFAYELLDEFADPGRTHHEWHFGLLRHDLTPKPSYRALRTLLRLAADTAGPPRPRRLAVGLDGPRDLRAQVLARSDGTHLVVLWRDRPLWDPVARRPVRVPARPVRVRFREAAPVRLYRLTDGLRPRLDRRTREVELELRGDVVVLAVGGRQRRRRR